MDPSIVVAVVAAVVSIVTAVLAFRSKRGETEVSEGTNVITADANLRDDQRDFIEKLLEANRQAMEDSNREREARRALESELRAEIDKLRKELRQTQEELEQEKRARAEDTARLRAQRAGETP